MIRIIYYILVSIALVIFGSYLLIQQNSSRGGYAAIGAGIIQGILGFYLLQKRNKPKGPPKGE